MMYNIRSCPFNGKYMTSYLMAIVMFAPSLTVCEIFAKQNFELENEDQDPGAEVQDLCHYTGNVRIHMNGSFQNFSYLGTYVYAYLATHTSIYIHEHTHEHKNTHTLTNGFI